MNDDRPSPSAPQTWDAAGYAVNARFVTDYGAPVLELLAPQAGERILDLGCGDGVLSAQLAARGATVVGIDSSADLVAAARAIGIDARESSGEALMFAAEFDAVFSNAALHWMTDPDAVIRGVRRALKPGGRFVGEFGGHGNVAAIRTALHAVLAQAGHVIPKPWYFPTVEAYARRLEAGGFAVRSCTLIARPTPLPTGMRGWLATFANPFVASLDPARRTEVLERVTALLAPILCDDRGRWTADYVRLRFVAIAIDA